jgi:hypothetical protein
MTTSKQNRRNNFFKPVKFWWKKQEKMLDTNPRRTGIWMAVILTLAFCVFVVRTYSYYTQPKQQNNIHIVKGFKENYQNDVSPKQRVSGSLDEYFRLLLIQEELEKMKTAPNNVDTVRVNELYDKLLKSDYN